jgi:hypothetical protein
MTEPGDTLVGRYRMVALEEEGPHHQCWEARLLITDRPVRVHLLEAAGGRAREAGRTRFLREMRRVAEVRHCGIAPILDGGPLIDDRHYLVQDGMGGETLAAHVARVGPPNPKKVERLMAQALDALGAAHRLGMVHRALSMKTLVVCLGGLHRSLAVVDLGVVMLLEASLDAPPGSLDPVALGMQPQGLAPRGPAASAAAGDVFAWSRIATLLLGRHADSGRWAEIAARTASPRHRLPSVLTMDALVRGEAEPDELEPPKSDRAPSYTQIDDADVLAERLAWFTRQAQWVEAIEVLVRLCELERDPVRAAQHALSAGMLIQGELGDEPRALRYFRLALDRCPEADRALELYEQIATRHLAWNDLADLYRQLLTRLPSHERSTAERDSRRFHLLVKLAKLAAERLGDRDAARQAHAEAAAMRPDDPALRDFDPS